MTSITCTWWHQFVNFSTTLFFSYLKKIIIHSPISHKWDFSFDWQLVPWKFQNINIWEDLLIWLWSDWSACLNNNFHIYVNFNILFHSHVFQKIPKNSKEQFSNSFTKRVPFLTTCNFLLIWPEIFEVVTPQIPKNGQWSRQGVLGFEFVIWTRKERVWILSLWQPKNMGGK